MSALLKGIIRNGRVEVEEPIDLPEGTEVVVTSGTAGPDGGPVPLSEITLVLAAMQRLQPLDIPEDVAADLDAWEGELERHGIDSADEGIEDVVR